MLIEDRETKKRSDRRARTDDTGPLFPPAAHDPIALPPRRLVGRSEESESGERADEEGLTISATSRIHRAPTCATGLVADSTLDRSQCREPSTSLGRARGSRCTS